MASGCTACSVRVVADQQAEMPVPSCVQARRRRIGSNSSFCLRHGASDREVHVPGRGTAARVMPVQRIEMTTQDMDVIADLMNSRLPISGSGSGAMTRPGSTRAYGQ